MTNENHSITYLTNEEKRNEPFTFKHQTLTYTSLKKFDIVKRYWNQSHTERSLLKDAKGNLYLYDFYEHMNFNSGDEITEFFFLVKDEADAENYCQKEVIELRAYLPYIYIDNNYNVRVRKDLIR